MTPPPRPPRWATALLRWVVPETYRDDQLGDLAEGYVRRLEADSHGAARRWYVAQVLRSLGPVLLLRLRLRRSQRSQPTTRMETVLRDIRFGIRSLVKNATFTTVAVVTLTLAIGVNTAIFSIVSVIVFADLPMQDAKTVVGIRASNAKLGVDQGDLSIPGFLDLRERATTVDSMAALATSSGVLTGGDLPVRVTIMEVTPNLFGTWHLPPILGRDFSSDEGVEGGPQVAILSYDFWQSRFGARRDVLGESVSVDGQPYRIIGIASPRLDFGDFGRASIIRPLVLDRSASRESRLLYVTGRLRPGSTQQQATEEVEAIGKALAREHPEVDGGWSLRGTPVLDSMMGDEGWTIIFLLVLTVSFVILIACANVANMLLARATARAKEMSLRAALGAGRGRLVRQLLTESLIISLVSAVLGIAFARGLLEALRHISANQEPVFLMADLDPRVLGFTLLVALVAPLAFGLLPALSASVEGPAGVLREGRSAGGGHGGRRTRSVLAGTQVALALALMVVAGLVSRTIINLVSRDPGFDPREIVAADLRVSDAAYPDEEGRRRFYTLARQALTDLPGVSAVTLTNVIPKAGFGRFEGIRVEGSEPSDETGLPAVEVVTVSPDFTSFLGLRILRGRGLAESDGPDAPRVALVARDLAEIHWPGQDPVGRRFRLGSGAEAPWVTVVGVVSDVAPTTDSERPAPYVYVPRAQSPVAAMTALVRTKADPAALAGRMREAIRAIDPDQPVDLIRTVEQAQYERQASAMALTTLFVIFAIFALAMAAVGIYGVMTYSVSQRTGEIGVRIALGAQVRAVRTMVVGQGMKVVLVGMAVGLAGAWALGRVLAGIMFEVSATDPVTFVSVPVILGVVAFFATWIPAIRATRAEPARVLRAE